MAPTPASPATGGATPRPGLLAGVGRQVDYWALAYRRTWKGSVVSSFVAPVLYVLAMGVLLGGFVDADPATLEGATSYLAFVVPGLVASHAMQTAVGETTYPVLGMLKWDRTYFAMLATPLTPRHLLAGHLAFVAFRLLTTCTVFLLAVAPFGVFATWWGAVAALGVQVLVGMVFAVLVHGFSTRVRSEAAFGVLFRVGVFPLFLFSGAFFPVDNLGPVLAWVAHLTPLWHGVDLARMLTLDTVRPGLAAVHVAVLLALLAVGWVWSVRGLERRTAQ